MKAAALRDATDAALVPHNLPASLTPLIGRERERAAVGDALRDGARLLTLTGPGGIGKTRLALEAASGLVRSDAAFPDGVWFVELAPLTDPARLVQVVSGVFGLTAEAHRSQAEVLVDALRLRRVLLVLDNCEHLVSACADLAHLLLRACPRVAVLATSREPLKVLGETVQRVPPLACPDPAQSVTPRDLGDFDAVRLFLERAAAARGGFCLTEHNAPAVAQICSRLDGIPLALELAAARTSALSVGQIAARLDDRFGLLAHGVRAAPIRQQTLAGAVGWSYELLDEPDRRLFRRLGIFAGGWTLEDAEAVCGEPDEPADRVLDGLARLVDKSLVQAEDGPGQARWYRLLDTLRHFALERLAASGEEALVRERHLHWYCTLAEVADDWLRWRRGLSWAEREQWLVRITWEYANCRSAWQWAVECGDAAHVDEALRLAVGLFPYFWVTSTLPEGRDWLDRLLALHADAPPTAARARALAAAAKLAMHNGDDTVGRRLAEAYLALPHVLWTQQSTALVHVTLAVVALRHGETGGARQHAAAGLILSRACGEVSAAMYPPYLASVAVAEGNLDEAQDLYEEGLWEGRAEDFRLAIGMALEGLGRVARLRGDASLARTVLEEALAALRSVGPMPQTGLVLVTLGELALQQGDTAQARARWCQGLELAGALGHRHLLASVFEGAAAVVLDEERSVTQATVEAVRLIGVAQHLRVTANVADADVTLATRALERAEAIFGRDALERRLTEGRAMTLEAAAEIARRALAERRSNAGSDGGVEMLTRREREVAVLLARGLTNRQIADALVISERTAEMHVGNLLSKLGLSSRAQAAVWASTHCEAAVRSRAALP